MSKVLVVGKKIDRNKAWKLGSHSIQECETYKYLGVMISRNINDHSHVEHLVQKCNRLIGYIKSVIGNLCNYNRVYYGDILWRTIALPSVNYGCPVWVGSKSDTEKIEKLQLQMARFILKVPRSTPCATLCFDQPPWLVKN